MMNAIAVCVRVRPGEPGHSKQPGVPFRGSVRSINPTADANKAVRSELEPLHRAARSVRSGRHIGREVISIRCLRNLRIPCGGRTS
jgi:hypothetical protein